jgi:flagellar motor switch/type III secretory pathway protein FliN
MSEESAIASLRAGLESSVESLTLAFQELSTAELRFEVVPEPGTLAPTAAAQDEAGSGDVETEGLEALPAAELATSAGLLIVIESTDGAHWLLACPTSAALPVSGAIPTAKLQRVIDAVREAVCQTITVKATHALSSKNLAETVRRATDGQQRTIILRVQPGVDAEAVQFIGPAVHAVDLVPTRLARQPRAYNSLEEGLSQLPAYARSLLKVRVPITVTLASTKRPIDSIIRLGPGAIIQFKKSCDDTLSLEVAGLHVAEGEAVKVGENFGLWITEIKLPDERFRSIKELL